MSECLTENVVDVRLPSGAVARLRPVAEDDDHLFQQVFDGMSSRARYLRFHAATPRLSAPALRALATVEEGRRSGVIALIDGTAVGVAQWVRDPLSPERAELSASVVDRHQRSGLGRAMVTWLARAAESCGVRELVCHVHPDNRLVRDRLFLLGARSDGEGVLLVPVEAFLRGESAAPLMVRWLDAVPGPRTRAGGASQRG